MERNPSYWLILIAYVCEKSILEFSSLGPDAKSAPRALHKGEARSDPQL